MAKGRWLTTALAVVAMTPIALYLIGYLALGKFHRGVSSNERQFTSMWYASIYQPMRFVEEKLTGKPIVLMGDRPYDQ